MQMLVEVSVGEVIDKITILELKRERIADASKLSNVIAELNVLNAAVSAVLSFSPEVIVLRQELYEVNAVLWDIEDDIRLCEQLSDFGPRFIELARAVYVTNDQRAAIKKKINLAVGSRLIEEKSYAGSL